MPSWPQSWGPAPRWATRRTPDRPTFGPRVGKVAALMGRPLMPWQQYVADVAHEIDPHTGWWAFDKIVITVQRRAGKTALDEAVKVDRLITIPRGRLWMSAQGGEESIDLWRELCGEDGSLARSPLRHKFRTYTTTGKERTVWLPTGAMLTPIPPNGDKVHGKAIHLLSLDELFVYTLEMAAKMSAGYRPTFLTTNAQAWLMSTRGNVHSAWLNQEVAEGRRAVELGANRGTAYFEWSVPDTIGGVKVAELDDDELIAAIMAYHPANGTHPLITPAKLEQFIRDDLADANMGRPGVLRAYGNVSDEESGDRLIHASVVTATTTLHRIPVSVKPAIAFDVDPKRRTSTIAAGWRDVRGVGLVEVIEHGLGTRWTASAVIGVLERQGIRTVWCNNAGAARDVADEIERAGYDVQRVGGSDYAAACARFHDEWTAEKPTLYHYGQSDFVEAAAHVGWRKLGQGLAFESVGEPITAITSSTLALWGEDHPPVVEPERPRSKVF